MTHLSVSPQDVADGRKKVYRLSGVLGESTYSFEFGETLRQELKDGPDLIVLNLADLEYITSSGVGVIASAYTSACRAERRLVLAAVPSKVRRVLDICGILDVVRAYDTEEEALAS